ncbi:DEAD/DEAH box helicase [Bacillus sp. NPDC077027]|uniref:DEAD/DEAH box helicase n=1 Tax=Bacillus sp. NPDC077027 TaxID=3390548 RepID=UPI003D08472C
MEVSKTKAMRDLLQYRHLLSSELPFSHCLLKWHERHCLLKKMPAIEMTTKGYTCKRCGATNKRYFALTPCEICQKQCVYCRSCIMMGKASECTFLYEWTEASALQFFQVKMTWDGELSSGQKAASKKIIEVIKKKEDLLIWAVCGAGKTELLFHGIEYALKKGKRVCIATPRTDVVLELEPRIRNVFMGIEIAALYGNSPNRFQTSPLTISTTHQLLRYKEAFDVMIIDEVDAFPYSLDDRLRFAVEKARRKDSVCIYLSATPSHEMKSQIEKEMLTAIKIPLRFHKHLLPVPCFKWIGHWKKKIKKRRLPFPLIKWLTGHVVQKRRVLLFVPSISIMNEVTNILTHLNINAQGVSAEDKDRKKKVRQFREHMYDVLVTTTILERGVTIQNVQVGVIGAEVHIFTESALVQIAGRVGRHPEYFSGDVYFFHYGVTQSMREAKKHISQMNKVALKEFSEK